MVKNNYALFEFLQFLVRGVCGVSLLFSFQGIGLYANNSWKLKTIFFFQASRAKSAEQLKQNGVLQEENGKVLQLAVSHFN